MSENNNDWWKPVLKAFAIAVGVIILVIVVGFGLLVGFCALAGRH
jgi:hypothetical protein